MKVVFLIPPVLDGTRDVDRCFGCNYSIYFLPLLPVLYMATLLKSEADTVTIIDFPAHKKTRNDFEDFIREDDADVYIFYTVFLCQQTDRIARDMLRKRPKGKAHFIFTGPQPTYFPDTFLDGEDTFVARGEPEFTVQELFRVLKSHAVPEALPGVSYFKGNAIVHNAAAPLIADIDQVPIPDRTLLDHKPYYNPKLRKMPHASIMTSRGCFGRCWFCVPSSLDYARELEHKSHFEKKPPPRLHSPQRVIEEFTQIARLGFRSVSVLDNEFLWSEQRTLEICEGIKGLGLEWSCLTRPDMITDKSAQAMAEAGCAYVDLGTESFDQRILDAIRKDMTPRDTRLAVETLRRHKIEVEINILFGATPEETEETIKKSIREVKKLNADYVLFSIANPFPGTDFYYAAKREGWMVYGDYVPRDPAKDSIISYPHLSQKKLERLLAYAYLSYYFSPRYLMRQLLHLKGPRDFFNKTSTILKFLKKNYLQG